MVHAPNPPIAPRTALWGLGFRFESIGRRFEAIYHDTKDVWLIGKWLSWPFYLIYWYFMQARDKTWEADDKLVWLDTWITGIIEGSTFRELLYNLSHNFRSIRDTPVNWVKTQLQYISWELRQLVNDPSGFVSDRLFGRFPILWQIVYNSVSFVFDKIYEKYPFLITFFINPFGLVISWVRGFWYWLDELDRDKSGTIINWVSWRTWWFRDFLLNPRQRVNQWLRESSWELDDLLTDPNQWIKDRIASSLGFQVYELINLPLTILRRIISIVLYSEGGLMNELEHAACQFILKFI